MWRIVERTAWFLKRPRVLAGLVAALGGNLIAAPPSPESSRLVEHQPRLKPDYTDLVLPPNIAPLNFLIQEQGSSFYVRVHGRSGSPIEISSSSPRITMPDAAWRQLLTQNKGAAVEI